MCGHNNRNSFPLVTVLIVYSKKHCRIVKKCHTPTPTFCIQMLHNNDSAKSNLNEEHHHHGVLKIHRQVESEAHGDSRQPTLRKGGCHHDHHRRGAFKRAVRFASTPNVREVPSFKELGYKKELWYDKVDYHLILVEDCEKTLLHMMANDDTDKKEDAKEEDTLFCTRGLEDKTWHGSRRHTRHILANLQAVLEEQNMQWEDNIYYPERLACISKSTSCASKDFALKAGKKDEAEVFGHTLSLV
jgi:hypothetical protein